MGADSINQGEYLHLEGQLKSDWEWYQQDGNAIWKNNWGREENNAAKSKFMGMGERHRVDQG